jgi:hypothetical protein
MVILSGYQHASYKPLEACGWVRKSCTVIAPSSNKRTKRTEQLWLSPGVIGRSGPNGRNRMQGGAYWTNLARVRATEESLKVAIERLRSKPGARHDCRGGSDRWHEPRASLPAIPAPIHSVMSGLAGNSHKITLCELAAAHQAASRTSLWIVVGLRFRVVAMERILALSARSVATCLTNL